MRTPSLRRALVAVAAATLLAGCGGYDQTAVPDVEPAPAATVPPAVDVPECGEVTRSYAPDGALPTPGDMPAGSTMADIVGRGRLVAGVSADTYLLGSRDPIEGRIQGFDIDMVERVSQAIFGRPDAYTLRVITASERIPLLEAGEVDLVVRNMTINCERWDQIAFSAEYYRSGQKVLVRKDLADDGVTGVDDLADLRVCAPAGTTSLTNFAREQPDAELVTASTHTGCLVKFQRGEVDAITGDDTVLAGLAAQDPYAVVPAGQQAFTDEPYGIGMNADDRDLVRFVNGVLEQMRADGSWDASYREWLQPLLGRGTGQPSPVYGR